MSYSQMLDKKCDIFHLEDKEKKEEGNFGINVSNLPNELEYSDKPDLKEIDCYYSKKSESIVQGEPQNILIQTWLLHFNKNVDVRRLDKVIAGGYIFTLQEPTTPKNHHIEVEAFRKVVL
ncbi:TPA_asm: DUF3599 family protein [Listeria monocytogenes]|nr:DUF3599 family protein [Listeria monocytogenes]